MGTAIKHPVPDRVKPFGGDVKPCTMHYLSIRVKPSFVIVDIRALLHSALTVRVPKCQKLPMMAYPGLAQDQREFHGLY